MGGQIAVQLRQITSVAEQQSGGSTFKGYVIRRLALSLVTILVASFLVFMLQRLTPGTIVDAMVGQYMGMNPDEIDIGAARAEIERALGLERPLFEQYASWLGGIVLRGDLGASLWRRTPVLEEIAARWPVTVELGLLGFIVSQIIALPIGIYSAVRQDSLGDYAARSFAIFWVAVPGFWVGTMVIVYTSIWWGYAPPFRYVRFVEDPIANLKILLIPALVLGMGMAGGTMRIARTMMLEVLRQDYIRTSWAKGLRERVILIRHALKNAMIPVVTSIGPQLLLMVGGSVIVEQIFNLPGMGRLTLQAIQTRDYTVVSGVLMIFSVAIVMVNLLIDLSYGYLDPRIRHERK